jgi:uncharacterized iron-regulated protein
MTLVSTKGVRTRVIALFLAVAPIMAGSPARAQGGDEPVLPDRIWSVREARPVTREELVSRLVGADLVLLGETHDNAHHHRVQLELMDALERLGRQPIVAMEQFDRERQSDLDAARGEPASVSGPDARPVASAAGFDFDGWSWALYGPIIERALARGWPLVAINLSRRDATRVVREGFGAFSPAEVKRLALKDPMPDDLLRALRDDIEIGHCGLLPARAVASMVDAQRARDAVMAERLLDMMAASSVPGASAARLGVAVLGRGHARLDRGVGLYLAARAPHRAVISIGLLESDAQSIGQGASGAAPGSGSSSLTGEFPALAAHNDALVGIPGHAAFDYLWFTPAVERADPCLAFVQDRKPPARP